MYVCVPSQPRPKKASLRSIFVHYFVRTPGWLVMEPATAKFVILFAGISRFGGASEAPALSGCDRCWLLRGFPWKMFNLGNPQGDQRSVRNLETPRLGELLEQFSPIVNTNFMARRLQKWGWRLLE